MKVVLSSEILRPKGGRELLESWDIEVNTMSSSGRKAWDSLALELDWLSESSQLAIVSVWRVSLIASQIVICSILYISCYPSSLTGLLFYSSNNLPVGVDPLHSTDERCSEEEDRCVKRCLRSWQGMVPDLLRWNSAWHDHPMFSFTPCRCSFSRWPATCSWQISKEALVLHRNGKSIFGQKISWQEPICLKKKYRFVR